MIDYHARSVFNIDERLQYVQIDAIIVINGAK